jgi:tripartite-type tricarboxylate transporter receptor subunit TctC
MKHRRFLTISIVTAFGLTLLAGHPVFAQSYPDKPINIVVPVPPGGLVDTFARAIAQSFGKPVIVENKPGGNFVIGVGFVGKAAPDGYTLLLAMDAPFIINPNLYNKLSYDADNDFAPITSLVRFQVALIAHPSFPANNVRELIELAKKKPGELNYGAFGVGSTANLYMEKLESMAGVKLVAVQYKGVAPMITDVIGGHVPLMFLSVGQSLPLWKEGKLKILGVATSQRVAQFPDTPTFSESGVPGFEAVQWFGLFAPKGTPREIVEKLNGEVKSIIADPKFGETVLGPSVAEPRTSSPEQFVAFIKSEREKWGEVIRDAKIEKID